MDDCVGPVLDNVSMAEKLIEALKQTNPDLEVVNEGSYLRVLSPGRCVLRRSIVERYMGTSFILPQSLEALMPSFKGVLQLSEDEAIWLSEGV